MAKVIEAPFRLTIDDGEKKPKKRGAIGERPDTIPADGTPAKALYDAIVGDEEIRAIIGNPGEFCLHCVNHNYRSIPVELLVWQVHDAALYLKSPSCRRKPTLRGGWQFMRNQFDLAANRHANEPRPAPPPNLRAPVKSDGRHTSHARQIIEPGHGIAGAVFGTVRTADPLMETASE